MIGGIGMGLINPAANNAVLDLVPEKVAAVTGIRGMFRITGGTFGTAAMVLVLSHYQDQALGFQQVMLFLSVFILLLIILIFLIPDNARQRRKKAERKANAGSPHTSS